MHEVEASDTERGMKRPLNEEDQSEEEVNTSKKQRATDNKPPCMAIDIQTYQTG